ncbi:helix-turn-helix transcriptional regulator [Nonomuraea sp. NPDC050786]|uniref:helix-turn-helix domain-containing protein n=1 Tax=Nonomuraea sp. NPDC050786 TaxID=3154840 RepID=UPI0033EAC416
MSERRTWADRKSEILSRPGAGVAYEAAKIRFELGETVRLRREQLGLTQAELAERTGLKQPAVARFEAGGTMPTIPMMEPFLTWLFMVRAGDGNRTRAVSLGTASITA